MDIVINMDNPTDVNNLPDDLFTVYVNDFKDSYHREESDEPVSELEREVRSITRRYRSMTDYIRACSIYDQWMEYLEDKYGGSKLLKYKIKHDLIPEYIPPKPKMKETKEVKTAFKEGIVLPHIPKSFIDYDALNRYMEEEWSEEVLNTQVNNVTINYKGKSKEVEKIITKHVESVTFMKSRSQKSDVDFLDEYFSIKNSRKKKSNKGKNKKTKYLISNFMGDNYLKYLEDTTEEDQYDLYNNYYGTGYLSASEAKEESLYRMLNNAGWDSYKIMRKRNTRSKKIAESIKKEEKKKKKKNKKIKKQRKEIDKVLVDMMDDNGYSDFEQFAKEYFSQEYYGY